MYYILSKASKLGWGSTMGLLTKYIYIKRKKGKDIIYIIYIIYITLYFKYIISQPFTTIVGVR